MITRDQRRAQSAYDLVGNVDRKLQDDYKIAINDLGSNVLKHGLAAAIAWLERRKKNEKAIGLVLEHLAQSDIPKLKGNADDLPGRVHRLELGDYMLATRETLKVVVWHKRAVQALFDKGGPDA